MSQGRRRVADPIAQAVRDLKPGEYVVVSKTTLSRLPPSYEQTTLGTPPALAHAGAVRQFRGPGRRHVYETDVGWIAHKDSADPRTQPLEHLILDTPELVGGLAVAAVAGTLTGNLVRKRKLEEGAPEDEANRDAIFWGLIAALIAGGATYLLIRSLKKRS